VSLNFLLENEMATENIITSTNTDTRVTTVVAHLFNTEKFMTDEEFEHFTAEVVRAVHYHIGGRIEVEEL